MADLVLVDMPPPDCFNAARAVLRKWPSVNIVAIGLDDSDSTALQCCQAGICWYLTAEHDWEILLRVLREIFGGQTPCAPRIAALLIRQVGAKQISDTGLTPREVDILRCLQERRTNKEIAQHLGIRMGTVKNHVHNILTKLHVPNRDSAAIMGVGTH